MFLLLTPRTASSIELRWSDGSLARSFTEATRCTLEVRADSIEQRLPAEWRLLWVADTSTVITPIPLSTSLDCEADVALVETLDPPATAADSSAHLLTAHFCSTSEAAVTTAGYTVDLPAGSAGKLKVVALDPADSTRVIESNEVTFNEGSGGDYPAVVLCASSVHQSLKLQVTAVGVGLSETNSLSLVAPDSSWSLPLTITARSNGAVTAVASVAALLPACEVSVGTEGGRVSSASLAADEEPAQLDPLDGGCSVQYFENLLQPPPRNLGYTIQPKDFAFARGFVDTTTSRYALHLFYIRHNYHYYQPPDSPQVWRPDLDEKNIGHIWMTNRTSWHGPDGTSDPDTVALTVVGRAGKFDDFHVWAPTIVQHGGEYWMFYTGVRNEGGRRNQRIGVARSSDLNTWTPADTAVLTAPDIPWASKNPTNRDGQQLRDPFVMKDPVNLNQWLMYFVAVESCGISCTPTMAVGVARSPDLIAWTALPNPISSTHRPTVYGATTTVESPHVFRRNGQWWMPYTVNNDRVFFETTTSADPADTVAANWTNPVLLQAAVEDSVEQLQYWHATEYLQSTSTEYLAAWNDNASSIEIMGAFPPTNPAVDSLRLDCPEYAGVADPSGSGNEVRMAISYLRLGAAEVGLRLELPLRMPVRLAVYDIAGRRRLTLLDRELPSGVTELNWDGRDREGARVASGMYFVRLTCARGARVSKLVMLR